jgi:hypothetical protein
VSVFDRFWPRMGKARDLATAARRAELQGDLARAAQLWADADRADEAARVMLLRGDAEPSTSLRLQHYVQAVALAPPGHAVRDIARRKRALLALGVARQGATSAAARQDLLEAALELESLGEHVHAADAYALAGDVEGEARALVQGGEVDRLEDVLGRDRDRTSAERRRQTTSLEIERLLSGGDRRLALVKASAAAEERREDASATERVRAIRARRAEGPSVTIELRGRRMRLVLGDEVVIGRSEGAIQLASHAVSRRHLGIARAEDRIVLRDLGSRNGTELRGMRIAGAIPVPMDEGLVLKLGGEVAVLLSRAEEIDGALAIEVAGAKYVAPLGVARLGIGAWRLVTGEDGWVELVTDDAPFAHLGGARLGPRTALLSGDAFTETRGGAVVLRIS